jgi:hypothetical protein
LVWAGMCFLGMRVGIYRLLVNGLRPFQGVFGGILVDKSGRKVRLASRRRG